MNAAEVAALLAVVATYDNRKYGEPEVFAWHSALGDLPFGLARDAVIEHFRSTDAYLMPVHIRNIVRTAQNDQAMRTLPTGSGDEVPMPEWFRSTMEGNRTRFREERKVAKTRGEPVTFGSQITTIWDGQ